MPAHILIVEDDKELTEAMEDTLKLAGYKTSVCTNYNNVFSCLVDEAVDLIVMDGYLNEYDGREILSQLKSMPTSKHIPVVFASVMTEEDLKNIKPDAVLQKAFGMHELLNIIKSQLTH